MKEATLLVLKLHEYEVYRFVMNHRTYSCNIIINKFVMEALITAYHISYVPSLKEAFIQDITMK